MSHPLGSGESSARTGRSPAAPYFPLWLGQLLSAFGDTLHYIALVVLVFELTGRGLAVAGLVAAEAGRRMRERGVRALLVATPDGALVGLLRREDADRAGEAAS